MALRKTVLVILTSLMMLAGCAAPPREQQAPASLAASPAIFTTPAQHGVDAAASPLKPEPRRERQLRLAVRFVSYLDRPGGPTASRALAHAFIERANEIYSSCGISFELEQYLAVRPRGVPFHLSSMNDLDPTRARFDDPARLVIIDTGNWNHSRMGAANAWTALPGNSPSGAVLEAAANDHAELIAHELGHYLNLDHVNDASNLMNPIIYHSSTRLNAGQCRVIRDTALGAREASLR